MGLRKKKSLVEQAIDQANDYLDAARPHVESAIGSAKDFVQDTALPALSDAKDKAGPALADAREKAGPILVDARDKAAAGLSDARDKAAPLVASGATVVAAKAGEARGLADAKVAQIKGEEPKKKGRLKKFVLFAAIAGAVAVVAKKLQGKQQSDNWQSSYTPTPAPASRPTPAAPQAGLEDPAGASPDEAISDAAEAPHPVTTPEEPAEVVDVDPEGESKS